MKILVKTQMKLPKKIESDGLKLFALGVGTDRGSKIRLQGGFKKDREGKDVITKLNNQSLKRLAADTGGKYF